MESIQPNSDLKSFPLKRKKKNRLKSFVCNNQFQDGYCQICFESYYCDYDKRILAKKQQQQKSAFQSCILWQTDLQQPYPIPFQKTCNFWVWFYEWILSLPTTLIHHILRSLWGARHFNSLLFLLSPGEPCRGSETLEGLWPGQFPGEVRVPPSLICRLPQTEETTVPPGTFLSLPQNPQKTLLSLHSILRFPATVTFQWDPNTSLFWVQRTPRAFRGEDSSVAMSSSPGKWWPVKANGEIFEGLKLNVHTAWPIRKKGLFPSCVSTPNPNMQR